MLIAPCQTTSHRQGALRGYKWRGTAPVRGIFHKECGDHGPVDIRGSGEAAKDHRNWLLSFEI